MCKDIASELPNTAILYVYCRVNPPAPHQTAKYLFIRRASKVSFCIAGHSESNTSLFRFYGPDAALRQFVIPVSLRVLTIFTLLSIPGSRKDK